MTFETWERYKSMLPRLKRWCETTQNVLKYNTGCIQGKQIRYPVLLDVDGEPCQDLIKQFLLWCAEQPDVQQLKEGVKFAQKLVVASMQLERSARDLAMLDEGAANKWMSVRVAVRQTKRTRGETALSSCTDMSKRADHLPTADEMHSMMRLCLAGDRRVHSNPLRVIQTGVEVRISHMAGVRCQLIRSAKFEHIWPRRYGDLAGGAGIYGTVMHNVRGDKTHLPGDGTHSGWMPHRNALLCADGHLGLSLLYRWTAAGESFPDVCAENGKQYKWLPLITTEQRSTVDNGSAQLAVRGISYVRENECFTQLYAAAGMISCTGDAVTHIGRHAGQQEAEDAGLDPRIVSAALGYQIKDAKKDHYTPHIPLAFQLQRGGHSFKPDDLAEVDSPQLRVTRSEVNAIRSLVDLVLPEIPSNDVAVSAIDTGVSDASSKKAVKEQRRANKDSHVREHRHFLDVVRNMISRAIVNAACRPRKLDGTIDYDAKSLIEEYGSGAVYKAIRIRATGCYHDTWLFDHPLFRQIASAVRHAEECERTELALSSDRQKSANAAAQAVVRVIGPTLSRLEAGLSTMTQNATAHDPAWDLHYEHTDCRHENETMDPIVEIWYNGAPFHTRFARACAASLLRDPSSLSVVLRVDPFEGITPHFSRDCVVQMLTALATGASPNANLPFDYARSHIRGHAFFAELPDGVRLNVVLMEYFSRQPGYPVYVEGYINEQLSDLERIPPPSAQDPAGLLLSAAAAAAAAVSAAPSTAVVERIASPAARDSISVPVPVAAPAVIGASPSSSRQLVPVAAPMAIGVGPSSSGQLVSVASPNGRRRRVDCPGLDHIPFATLGNVELLWREYVDVLRPRDNLRPDWKKGPMNKPIRDLYNDKCFFYREIVGTADALGSIDCALRALQVRLDGCQTARTPTHWTALLKQLQKEQPEGGECKKKLEQLLGNLDAGPQGKRRRRS